MSFFASSGSQFSIAVCRPNSLHPLPERDDICYSTTRSNHYGQCSIGFRCSALCSHRRPIQGNQFTSTLNRINGVVKNSFATLTKKF